VYRLLDPGSEWRLHALISSVGCAECVRYVECVHRDPPHKPLSWTTNST
jgi:hypothetical protein